MKKIGEKNTAAETRAAINKHVLQGTDMSNVLNSSVKCVFYIVD